MRPRTQARNRKTPEMLQSLLDLKTRLQAAPHGGQRALVEEFAASVGKSCATVYKWLTDEVGYSSGRKPRADAGTTRLAPDVLQFVAAAKQESIRANGKATMGTPVAMSIAAANGLDINVSGSRLQTLLRQHGMQPGQLRDARNTQQMRSEHPNHVHQIDPSLCLVYYMGGKQRVMRDDEFYKNKLDAVARIKLKVWRYVRVDHFSGAIDIRYFEAAGENQAVLFDFLMHTWGRHATRLSHGLPRLLLWDKGSANTSHGIQRLLDALGVQHETHAAGHAWAKGGVEVSNNIVETQFESRLRFEPVESVEELNAAAEAWVRDYNANAIAHVDARVHRPGGDFVRDDLWHGIRAEQLVALPERSVCLWFLAGKDATRKVNNLRISFAHPELERPGQYDLRAWADQLYKGQEVTVTPLLLKGGAVRVSIERLGREPLLVEVMPEVDFDQAGRPMSATVFGERSAMPHDASVTTAKQLVQAAYGDGTSLEDAEAKRRTNTKPFAHLNDGKGIVAHSHLGKEELPTRLQRQAQELDTPAIAAARTTPELAPMNVVTASLRLRGMLGRNLLPEENAWLRKQYADDKVPVEHIDAIAARLRGDDLAGQATGTHHVRPFLKVVGQ